MSINKRNGEKGSVSVYFIIVLVPIFVFVTVLIDFARIGAADRESELAVKAGVRSAMSAFDNKLQKYGLYGLTVSQQQAQELFTSAVTRNVPGGDGGYIDTTLITDSATVRSMITLAYPDVFRREVLEEMKYRAPVEFTLEVADKLQKTGMTTKLTNGKAYSEDAGNLETLIDRREDSLDEVWSSFAKLHEKLRSEHDSNQNRLEELNRLADQIGLNTLEDVKNSLAALKSQVEALEQSIRDMDSALAAMAAAVEKSEESIRSLSTARASLSEQLQELLTKQNELEHLLQLLLEYTALIATTRLETAVASAAVTDLQTSIDQALAEAKKANDALRAEWNRLNGTPVEIAANGGGAAAVFGAVRVLPDEYFTEFQTDVASIAALFGAYTRDIQAALSYADDKVTSYLSKNQEFLDKSNSVYNSRLAAEEQRQARNEQVKSRKRQLWSAISDVLDQAKQAIGGCRLGTEGEPDRKAYEQLQANTQKYEQSNANLPDSGESVVELNDSKRIGSDALRLGGLIAGLLEGARDSAYINEFALSKFNNRTFGLERLGNGQTKPPATFSEPDRHSLSAQEAEYVLYGFSSCSANITAAYGEIFAIRLAIRTLERLTDPKNELLQLGSPLLVLLAAAAEGAVDALQDMNRLVKGEEVPLSSKLADTITLTYKDYLRLLLFLHGGTDRKLARLQALIELNTGVDLRQAATQLQAGAGTSVKLWFLPGAVKLFGLAGLSPCRVQGSRCLLYRSASLSY